MAHLPGSRRTRRSPSAAGEAGHQLSAPPRRVGLLAPHCLAPLRRRRPTVDLACCTCRATQSYPELPRATQSYPELHVAAPLCRPAASSPASLAARGGVKWTLLQRRQHVPAPPVPGGRRAGGERGDHPLATARHWAVTSVHCPFGTPQCAAPADLHEQRSPGMHAHIHRHRPGPHLLPLQKASDMSLTSISSSPGGASSRRAGARSASARPCRCSSSGVA